MKIQKPSLGRVVIFTAWRGQGEESGKVDQYAGVIVGVSDDKPGVIDIVTLGPSSVYHNNGARFDADGSAGTWRYPPFVKDEIEV
jgi:hypothetical protein